MGRRDVARGMDGCVKCEKKMSRNEEVSREDTGAEPMLNQGDSDSRSRSLRPRRLSSPSFMQVISLIGRREQTEQRKEGCSQGEEHRNLSK